VNYLVAVSNILFIITGIFVGGKLALLALRTHKLPETAFAVRMLCTSALGLPLMIAARIPGLVSDGVGVDFVVAGYFFLDASMVASIIFTWKVFRQGERLGIIVATTMFALVLVHAIVTISLSVGSTSVAEISVFKGQGQILTSLAMGAVFLWCTYEPARYYRTLLKRCALGLSSPVVASLTSAIALVLAFVPPHAYLRFIEGRTGVAVRA